jgi:hypothetical protein
MKQLLMKTRDILRDNGSRVFAAASLVVAIMALLWGSGVLSKPKLLLSSGAIYLRIPAKITLELSAVRLMTQAPTMEEEFSTVFTETLKGAGMSEERIAEVQEADAVLDPDEERLVNAAAAKAMAGLQGVIADSMKIPSSILFFEIRNEGAVSAKDVHVVIKLKGRPLDLRLETDNKLLSQESRGSEYYLDFAAVAPRSLTKGIVWYSGVDPDGTAARQNAISISYEHDTIRQNVPEDTFFVRR